MSRVNPLFEDDKNVETASRHTEEALNLTIPCWAGPPGDPPIPVLFELSTRTVTPDLKRM